MKYLKAYESIEATKNWISEVMNTCKDIMVELEDAGMKTEVKRSLKDKSVLIECLITSNSRSGSFYDAYKTTVKIKNDEIVHGYYSLKGDGFSTPIGDDVSVLCVYIGLGK
jgi:hypothetical protein